MVVGRAHANAAEAATNAAEAAPSSSEARPKASFELGVMSRMAAGRFLALTLTLTLTLTVTVTVTVTATLTLTLTLTDGRRPLLADEAHLVHAPLRAHQLRQPGAPRSPTRRVQEHAAATLAPQRALCVALAGARR